MFSPPVIFGAALQKFQGFIGSAQGNQDAGLGPLHIGSSPLQFYPVDACHGFIRVPEAEGISRRQFPDKVGGLAPLRDMSSGFEVLEAVGKPGKSMKDLAHGKMFEKRVHVIPGPILLEQRLQERQALPGLPDGQQAGGEMIEAFNVFWLLLVILLPVFNGQFPPVGDGLAKERHRLPRFVLDLLEQNGLAVAEGHGIGPQPHGNIEVVVSQFQQLGFFLGRDDPSLGTRLKEQINDGVAQGIVGQAVACVLLDERLQTLNCLVVPAVAAEGESNLAANLRIQAGIDQLGEFLFDGIKEGNDIGPAILGLQFGNFGRNPVTFPFDMRKRPVPR